MRRRQGTTVNGAVIDLTSLLDVIFIVLMAVMATQKEATEDLKNQQAAAETATDQYEDVTAVENIVHIVSITVPYDENDPASRTIYVLKEGQKAEDAEHYELNGSNTDAYDRLNDYLTAYVDEYKDSKLDMVIFVLNGDEEKILYRDEVKVIEILKDVSDKSEKEKVYWKVLAEEED